MALRADAVAGHSFEQEWPLVARRLNSMLAHKGIPAFTREDIVQETGLRLFRMWPQVDPDRPVWALAVTIALNLWRDEARRGSSREILGVVPETAAPYDDVERAGLARIELRRVEKALTQMTPDHRSILLAELGEEHTLVARGPNAVKMLRMRARRRLSSLLDSASSLGGIAGLRLRRLLGLEHQIISLRGATGSAENAIVPAAAGVLAALTLFAAGAPGLDGFISGGGHDLGWPAPRPAGAIAVGVAPAEIVSPVPVTGAPTTTSPRRVGRSRSVLGDRSPYRVPVGDGYVEGEAELGLLGLGAEFGDRGGRPACLKGEVVPRRSGLRCRTPGAAREGPGGINARVYLRVELGPIGFTVDAGIH